MTKYTVRCWAKVNGEYQQVTTEQLKKAAPEIVERMGQAMQEYSGPTGDAPYCWLVNANHVYLAADGFSFGEPVVQPHGGRIFDNITEWRWEE